MVQFLLRNGADANIPDKKGLTPLHMAVFSNDNDIVKLLLKGGADIHAADLAIAERNPEALKLLQQATARREMRAVNPALRVLPYHTRMLIGEEVGLETMLHKSIIEQKKD